MICCVAANTERGDELKAIRERIGMSMTKFAEKIDVKRSTYKNWEYGVVQGIPDEVMARARSLDRDEVSKPLYPVPMLRVEIPSIGMVATSSEVDWTDPFSTETMIEVPPEMAEIRGRFACIIEGDSMYDMLKPGDIAVFQKFEVQKIGFIVLFRSFDNRITIKVLKHDGRDYILHPINPGYEDVVAKGSQVGYLVGVVRQSKTQKITVYDPHGIMPGENI